MLIQVVWVQHDAQMDYYGKRLATCSSDRTVRIFEVNNPDPAGEEMELGMGLGPGGAGNESLQSQQQGQPTSSQAQTLIAQLLGHEGPVWQVAWAHPKFGSILASCSYDRNVIIWKEMEGHVNPTSTKAGASPGAGAWTKLFQYAGHDLSVNSIAWANHEHGLILACGSSDGTVSIVRYTGTTAASASSSSTASSSSSTTTTTTTAAATTTTTTTTAATTTATHTGMATSSSTGAPPASSNTAVGAEWQIDRFVAHPMGVNSVSWCPGTATLAPTADANVLRLATAGCDNTVKIWALPLHPAQVAAKPSWQLEATLQGHTDWVRDVQWAPSVGLVNSMLASAGQDGQVFVWTQETSGKPWQRVALEPNGFGEVVWRVSWSLSGNILAVTCGDSKVSLWKESLDRRQWHQISQLDAS